MFKTARFRIHNPSRHKQVQLQYALTHYHQTLKRVLERALADPDFEVRTHELDKNGKLKPNKYKIAKFLREIPPKDWALAPLRDYLISDGAAMVLSHLNKVYKGRNESNPPTIARLQPLSSEEYRQAYNEFTGSHTFPLKEKHADKIKKARQDGHPGVAARLYKIYSNWAATKAAGLLLQRLEGATPRPIEFTHCELERGFLLARKENKYYMLVRLFGRNSKYRNTTTLDDGFVNCKTNGEIGGKIYPGLIFPLEFGREFHQLEYLAYGTPQSAKLVAKRNGTDGYDFFFHIAFEFKPKPISATSVLGIDRGATKLGAGTLLSPDGKLIQSGIDLDGTAFSEVMKRLRAIIAEQQRKGVQKSRTFKLRGRKSDIVLGEYANRIIQIAKENRALIVLEAINQRFMAGFLTQSQFGKLKSMLDYKAERVGLPPPIEVPAAYTSQTCAVCGHKDRANRPKKDNAGRSIQDVFLCVQCGYRANADHNASEIIALRGIHQVHNGGQKFRKFEDFQPWLKELVGRDESRAQRAHDSVVSSA